MSQPDRLAALSEWFSEHCNGKWEHSYGIEIKTLDNPGWNLEVDLRDTALEQTSFEAVKVNKSKTDWFMCFKEDGKFVGAGDPSKLSVLLEHFLVFAGK
jgi:elongation factor P hydroxylase